MSVVVQETHANPKRVWRVVGTLDGCPIWRHDDGNMAIERDFERLCELTPAEVAQLGPISGDGKRGPDGGSDVRGPTGDGNGGFNFCEYLYFMAFSGENDCCEIAKSELDNGVSRAGFRLLSGRCNHKEQAKPKTWGGAV